MTIFGWVVDTRLLAYMIWGVGTLAVYSVVLFKRRRQYLRHRDARARRDLVEGVALWVVSLASTLAVTFVLFGESATGMRGLMSAIALGAYAAAGLVMASEKVEDRTTVVER